MSQAHVEAVLVLYSCHSCCCAFEKSDFCFFAERERETSSRLSLLMPPSHDISLLQQSTQPGSVSDLLDHVLQRFLLHLPLIFTIFSLTFSLNSLPDVSEICCNENTFQLRLTRNCFLRTKRLNRLSHPCLDVDDMQSLILSPVSLLSFTRLLSCNQATRLNHKTCH